MASLIAQLVLYLPPLVFGAFMFRRLRRKYARPLGKGTDPRVYLYTVLATGVGYLVYVALVALVLVLRDNL